MFAPAYQSFSYRNTERTMRPKPKADNDVVVKTYHPRERKAPTWREQVERQWAARQAADAAAREEASRAIGAANEALRAMREAEKIPVMDIISNVAAAHGLTAAIILGPRRSKHIVVARHEAICLAAKLRPDLSIIQLGRQFNRDHTTILHALQRAGKPTSREARQHSTDRET